MKPTEFMGGSKLNNVLCLTFSWGGGSAPLQREILDSPMEFAGQHFETRENNTEEDCNVVNFY